MKSFLKQASASFITLVVPAIAAAQSGQTQVGVPGGGSNPKLNVGTATQVGQLIANIANFMGSLILAISVIVILYAGFRFLTAGEEEEAITGARKMITWGIVGIIVALVAYSIPTLVTSITGATAPSPVN
ncbi:MAG: hypothetical protein AAB796_00400 [Patescibacteria group bacterium]|mgnify:FL=1